MKNILTGVLISLIQIFLVLVPVGFVAFIAFSLFAILNEIGVISACWLINAVIISALTFCGCAVLCFLNYVILEFVD